MLSTNSELINTNDTTRPALPAVFSRRTSLIAVIRTQKESSLQCYGWFCVHAMVMAGSVFMMPMTGSAFMPWHPWHRYCSMSCYSI